MWTANAVRPREGLRNHTVPSRPSPPAKAGSLHIAALSPCVTGHHRVAPQQIVDLLPESARDPEAPCFADADVRHSSRGQLRFLGYLPQSIVVSQPAERVVGTGWRTWSSEVLPEFLEALVRSLVGDQPALLPQPDTGERPAAASAACGAPGRHGFGRS